VAAKAKNQKKRTRKSKREPEGLYCGYRTTDVAGGYIPRSKGKPMTERDKREFQEEYAALCRFRRENKAPKNPTEYRIYQHAYLKALGLEKNPTPGGLLYRKVSAANVETRHPGSLATKKAD
jgi:hypothetical protein